ncbi:MAG: STAS domain-containing protein [Planctomycetes bacterium]|nr:STAS domain-containing protein [Planctomycetota bacterium]
MSNTVDLGPLSLTDDGACCHFTFATPNDMLLELPPRYREELSAKLADVLPDSAERTYVLELGSLPGISSRQLGVMLTLHKVLRERIARLPLTEVSDAVRKLLKVTRTERFFDVR